MFCIQKVHAMNKTVHSRRERVQIFCLVQCLSALTGILLYMFARHFKVILIVNTITLALALLGHIGSRNLKKSFIGVHAVGTVCGLGGFFLFELFEALYSFSADSAVLLAFSLPYLIDFISGCYSVNLLVTLLELEDSDSSLKEELKNLLNNCVVCMENPKEVLLYPCGHRCLCARCSVLLHLSNFTCPICRAPVNDLVRIYET